MSWFVNPILVAARVCASKGRRGAALKVAVPSFLLSLCFLGVDTIAVPDGQTQSHIAPATGYTLWVLGTLVAMIAAVLVKPREAGDTQRPATPRSR